MTHFSWLQEYKIPVKVSGTPDRGDIVHIHHPRKRQLSLLHLTLKQTAVVSGRSCTTTRCAVFFFGVHRIGWLSACDFPGDPFPPPATDDAKLCALEEENERLRAEVAGRAGTVQRLRAEVAALKREASPQETDSPGPPLAEAAAEQEVGSLKTLLERLWAQYQELQERYEEKDRELVKAQLEFHSRGEEQEQALTQLRIQCNGAVPLHRLESLLSQFRRAQQEEPRPGSQDSGPCKKCSALSETLKVQAEELLTARHNAKLLQKMLDEERRNLHITANSLRAKEAIVQELRSALSRSATENTAPWDDRKLRKSLRVAMLTVSSLQALLRQKEASVERYRRCVASLSDELRLQGQRHSAEAHALRARLLDIGRQRGDDEDGAEGPAATDFERKLEQLRTLDEAHMEAFRLLLVRTQRPVQEEPRTVPAEPAASPIGEKEPPTRLLETVQSLQKLAEEKDALLAEKEATICELEAKLAALGSRLEEAGRRKDLASLVHSLKAQMDDKERQLKALSRALVELRAEMVRAAELDVVAGSADDGEQRDSAQLRRDLQAARERERFLEDEARLLREENEALKEECRKSQEERLRAGRSQKSPLRRGT
ncbi:uncharacterized protein LOC144105200 [Amblyomma americanum]